MLGVPEKVRKILRLDVIRHDSAPCAEMVFAIEQAVRGVSLRHCPYGCASGAHRVMRRCHQKSDTIRLACSVNESIFFSNPGHL